MRLAVCVPEVGGGPCPTSGSTGGEESLSRGCKGLLERWTGFRGSQTPRIWGPNLPVVLGMKARQWVGCGLAQPTERRTRTAVPLLPRPLHQAGGGPAPRIGRDTPSYRWDQSPLHL